MPVLCTHPAQTGDEPVGVVLLLLHHHEVCEAAQREPVDVVDVEGVLLLLDGLLRASRLVSVDELQVRELPAADAGDQDPVASVAQTAVLRSHVQSLLPVQAGPDEEHAAGRGLVGHQRLVDEAHDVGDVGQRQLLAGPVVQRGAQDQRVVAVVDHQPLRQPVVGGLGLRAGKEGRGAVGVVLPGAGGGALQQGQSRGQPVQSVGGAHVD